MACVTKKYIDPRICSSCKRISGKHFLQLKTIDMMDRATWETGSGSRWKNATHAKGSFAETLSRRQHQVWHWHFLQWQRFSFKQLNEHRFNGTPKYLFRSMLSTKRHTVNFAFSTSKHNGLICQVLYGYIIWRSCFPSGADNQGET